ncbi:MAG: endonuclease III [Acidobacteriota bacterium]
MTARAPAVARGRRPPRLPAILRALHRAHPDPRVELDHESPFQLLIATILSAQCTDARVNQVTPGLFRAYPDAAALARAPLPALEEAIRTTGFFRAKARSIQNCCRALVERHSGEVPRSMEELTRLPGVGRKTANVILGAGYGICSGIVVDTHMGRVARRLGLTRQSDPARVERDLMRVVPPREWIFFSITMILHGRYVCRAERPRCSACVLGAHCPSRHLERRGPPVTRGRSAARRFAPPPRPRRPRA